MHNFESGDLRIEAETFHSGSIRLDWQGKSADRQPGKVLGPFFNEVATWAEAHEGDVEMHFEALEHFNSSTITALIGLIQDLRKRGVKLTIVYDDHLKWQKLSFDALRIFQKQDGLLSIRGASE